MTNYDGWKLASPDEDFSQEDPCNGCGQPESECACAELEAEQYAREDAAAALAADDGLWEAEREAEDAYERFCEAAVYDNYEIERMAEAHTVWR